MAERGSEAATNRKTLLAIKHPFMKKFAPEKTMLKSISYLIAVGLFTFASASEPQPLTLDEAKVRALRDNPVLMQAELDVKAARWGMLGAIADALPEVSFNSTVIRSDDETVFRQNIMRDVILQEYGQYIDPEDFPPFAYKDMYSSNISVEQPIYNGGIELTALRIAGTRKNLINTSRSIQEREVILGVEISYYNLCRAYKAVEVQREALEVTRGYLERFRRRETLGLIPHVDVLRWEVEHTEAEAALIEASNNLRLTELALEHVMGVRENKSYYPADLPRFLSNDSDEPLTQLEPPEILWEKIKDNSPDLRISRDGVKLEGHNVWIASSNFQPKVNFKYIYSWQADADLKLDGFESWTAAISLRMPLFSSFGNVAKFQEARLNLKRAKENARDFETLLHMQLVAAYNDLTSARARLSSARKMVNQTKEVLETQEKRHELGLITTLELLDARTTDLSAELNVVNARFDALTARSQLIRIAGDAIISN